jgi:hypothetical protein
VLAVEGRSLQFAANAYLEGVPNGQCGKINRDVDGQLLIESSSQSQVGRETLSHPSVLPDGEKQIRQQRVANA